MPQFLVFPLSEFLEVPVRPDLFGWQNLDSSVSDSCELDFVNRVAVSFVEDSKTLVEYFLGFFYGLFRIPVVGEDGETEVLAEAGSDVIFADVSAEEIDAGEEGFAIFVTSNDEVVIERVLLVSSRVGDGRKVVRVLLN